MRSKMRVMKKYLILLLCFMIQGCSSVVELQRLPSDLVMVSIKPNNEIDVFYNVKSILPEPFVYKNQMGYKFIFPLNKALNDNIDTYMITKFNNIIKEKDENKSFHNINILVESCDIEYNLKEKLFSDNIAVVDVEFKIIVDIYQKNKLIGKKNIIVYNKAEKEIKIIGNIENI